MDRNKVEDVLLSMGITANLKGFQYIADALDVVERDGCEVSMTKVLYPEVAKNNNTIATRVERAIRHAIGIGNSTRGNYEVFEKYIGHLNHTNGAALTSLYKNIKKEEKREEINADTKEISPDFEIVIRKILREELKRIVSG